METVRVRKAGFAVRIPHDDFLKRYRVIDPMGSLKNLKEAMNKIIAKCWSNPNEYCVGKTKVFMKNVLIEVKLKSFVCKVDTQLFKTLFYLCRF